MKASGGVKALALGALLVIGFGRTAEASKSHASHAGSAHASNVSHRGGHGSLMHGSALHGMRDSRRHGSGVYAAEYGARNASWQRHGHGYSHGHRFASRGGYSGGGGLQCVTFARSDSGIELSGNANTWWDHAAGLYARGTRPEPGSVLNFRANGSMRMGHVAVVSNVVNSRTIEIDHANWAGPGAVPGGVSRDISVVDVSPSNDWSAVRVGLGHSGDFGSIYPTYGFIYNRPDNGTMVASADHSAPIPELNPAPRDLRGSVRDSAPIEEVAEAPDSPEPFTPHYGTRHHRRATTVAVHHRRHHP
ncbi:MAG: CHAP domain-containing protein [Acetobacteraceae bacterium]